MEELTQDQKLKIINAVVHQLKNQINTIKDDDAESKFLRRVLGIAIVTIIVVPLQ